MMFSQSFENGRGAGNTPTIFLILASTLFILSACTADKEISPPDRLLLKGGVNQSRCSNSPFVLKDNFVNNPYAFEGNVVDKCEITPDAAMIFIFKQHDQSIRNHTGKIIINLKTVNVESHGILQVLTARESSKDYPGTWVFCGNIENIPVGYYNSKIICSGEELKFVKIKAGSWSPASIFLDNVEVWRG